MSALVNSGSRWSAGGTVALLASAALFGSAAAAHSDPLPPGYAYEMVSPVRSQGQRVSGNIGTDSNTVLLKSTGGFAGTENLPDLGVEYLADRTAGGWVPRPIAPPASQFPFIGTYSAVDYSADLRRSIWYVNRSEDRGTWDMTPIVRDEAGAFHDAGPTLANDSDGKPIGSSEDLTTVALNSTARPALTDGTVDSRSPSVRSLLASTRNADGSLSVRQVAYRLGATMLPNCNVRLGSGRSSRNAVSGDGSKFFFSMYGLGSCTSSANARVWAKVGAADPVDLAAPQCAVPANCGGNLATAFEGASRDGSRVFFTTEQKLVDEDLDTSSKRDLYEYDFTASGPKLRTVTGSSNPGGAGVVGVVRVSEDGSRVYFVANKRPLAGANARGETPVADQQNLYVYHRAIGGAVGSVSFVAPLPSSDSDLWDTDVRRRIQLSPDGRFAIFGSRGDLTGDRLAGDVHEDIFRFDAVTDDLTRIWSLDAARNGASRVAGAYLNSALGGLPDGGLQKTQTAIPQITDDGSMIGFETAEPLSSEDHNNEIDAYLWRAETGAITMLTSGTSAVPSRFSGITSSGDMMLVSSSAPLVKAHTAGSIALFAIRQGGGFPDPPDPPAPCVGDACQGSGTPLGPLPDIQPFRGSGNVPEPTALARPQVRAAKSVRGAVASVKVTVPVGGTLVASGAHVRRVTRKAMAGAPQTLKLKLTAAAQRKLRKAPVKAHIRISFRPSGGGVSIRKVTVTFRAGPRAARSGAKVGR